MIRPTPEHRDRYKAILLTLRKLREEKGLTQTEVAQKFGSYASYISKMETGERLLTLYELWTLQDIYEVSRSEFMKLCDRELESAQAPRKILKSMKRR